MAKKLPRYSGDKPMKASSDFQSGQRTTASGQNAVQRHVSDASTMSERSLPGYTMPPEGPSNIIVVTPNFLPVPKNVRSQ